NGGNDLASALDIGRAQRAADSLVGGTPPAEDGVDLDDLKFRLKRALQDGDDWEANRLHDLIKHLEKGREDESFEKVEHSLAHKKGVQDPKALAAWIGREHGKIKGSNDITLSEATRALRDYERGDISQADCVKQLKAAGWSPQQIAQMFNSLAP